MSSLGLQSELCFYISVFHL